MLDTSKTFEQYEALVAEIDKIFNTLQSEHPECVRCEIKCSDCCHAVFDLTLVESVYLNYHFHRSLPRKERRAVIKRAEKADRKYYQIKKRLQKLYINEGKTPEEILFKLAHERIPCPLLNDDDQCDAYDYRPITCRAYGIPTSIGGQGHICEKAGFKEGIPYPTINLDKINDRLFALSHDMLKEIGAKNLKLYMSLVPPSSALMMEYNEAYFSNTEQDET